MRKQCVPGAPSDFSSASKRGYEFLWGVKLIGSCAVGAPELSSLESSMYHAVLYQWVILVSGRPCK